jgi:hypothetical protein
VRTGEDSDRASPRDNESQEPVRVIPAEHMAVCFSGLMPVGCPHWPHEHRVELVWRSTPMPRAWRGLSGTGVS